MSDLGEDSFSYGRHAFVGDDFVVPLGEKVGSLEGCKIMVNPLTALCFREIAFQYSIENVVANAANSSVTKLIKKIFKGNTVILNRG